MCNLKLCDVYQAIRKKYESALYLINNNNIEERDTDFDCFI